MLPSQNLIALSLLDADMALDEWQRNVYRCGSTCGARPT